MFKVTLVIGKAKNITWNIFMVASPKVVLHGNAVLRIVYGRNNKHVI